MSPIALIVMLVTRNLSRSLASLWAYVALGASVVVVEEAAPVLAGFAAQQRHLPVVSAAIVCAIGAWLTTVLPYALGRWGVTPLLRRFPSAAAALARLTDAVARRPWRASLASRFLFGARTFVPLACAIARVPPFIFLVGSAISAVVWATLFTALGWMSGDAVLLMLGRVRRHETTIAAVLACLILLAILIVNRRNRSHVVEEIVGHAGPERAER